MGGCCSSSKNNQLHGTPVYYYCPPPAEEHRSLTSHDSAAIARTTGFIVDLNLDASSSDTFQRPPTPIPFDVVLGYPQTIDSDFAGVIINGSSLHKGTYVNHKELDCKVQVNDLASSTKFGVELSKLNDAGVPTEEEDVCPTCFEDYDAENPKIITKCNHHFHLSCILEWMERSDTCPICDQVFHRWLSIEIAIRDSPFLCSGNESRYILLTSNHQFSLLEAKE